MDLYQPCMFSVLLWLLQWCAHLSPRRRPYRIGARTAAGGAGVVGVLSCGSFDGHGAICRVLQVVWLFRTENRCSFLTGN